MTASTQEFMDQIGFSAGEVYQYLNSNGTSTVSKIKKDLDLKGNFAEMAIGWLARENKVSMSKKGSSVNVTLND